MDWKNDSADERTAAVSLSTSCALESEIAARMKKLARTAARLLILCIIQDVLYFKAPNNNEQLWMVLVKDMTQYDYITTSSINGLKTLVCFSAHIIDQWFVAAWWEVDEPPLEAATIATPAATTTAPAANVPAESPANTASPPAAPAVPAPSTPASPAAPVSAAPVALGSAVSAALASALNPGRRTILTAKMTTVMNAVQLCLYFIPSAPFKKQDVLPYSITGE
jgi:hypothetical protein